MSGGGGYDDDREEDLRILLEEIHEGMTEEQIAEMHAEDATDAGLADVSGDGELHPDVSGVALAEEIANEDVEELAVFGEDILGVEVTEEAVRQRHQNELTKRRLSRQVKTAKDNLTKPIGDKHLNNFGITGATRSAIDELISVEEERFRTSSVSRTTDGVRAELLNHRLYELMIVRRFINDEEHRYTQSLADDLESLIQSVTYQNNTCSSVEKLRSRFGDSK